MRPVFLPRLLHEPTGDPGLLVDVHDENRALLLDLGDLGAASTRRLLRVERVFVTHTHMDHFVGFDRLLRLVLGREKELVVTGPPGFLERVRGKLSAYTWNLIREYPVSLLAEEVDVGACRAERYVGARGFRPEPQPERAFHGTLHAERLFTVHGALLDHGIPVLAVSLRETEHISVNRDRVERLGLEPGPWLREVKQAVRRCQPGDRVVEAAVARGGRRSFRLDDLAAEILLRGPGQRLAYVTDCAATPENLEKIVDLARDADVLCCECAFLHEDEGLARSRGHLTARQAGEIARVAGARRLAPFHLSPRYKGREQDLFDEAAAAFGGPILRLWPRGHSSRDCNTFHSGIGHSLS